MGFLGGEPTEDINLRPDLAVVGIAVGVAIIQVTVFPRSSEVHWLRFAVELLLILIPIVNAFVVGGTRHVSVVWRPLYAGIAPFAVCAVSDAVDETVARPEVVMLVFEDRTFLVGSVALVVGVV